MSRQLTVRCDECGAVKGETNHWLVVAVRYETPRQSNLIPPVEVEMFEGIKSLRCIFITKPSSTYDERFHLIDVCGRQCAIQFVSKKMEELL